MKLIQVAQQFLPGNNTEKLSLDELYELANAFGKVEIGGILGREAVDIKLNFTGEDYVCVKCRNSPNMKENLAACIAKAQLYKKFYQENGI